MKLHFLTVHDSVDHAVLEKEFAALKSVGSFAGSFVR